MSSSQVPSLANDSQRDAGQTAQVSRIKSEPDQQVEDDASEVESTALLTPTTTETGTTAATSHTTFDQSVEKKSGSPSVKVIVGTNEHAETFLCDREKLRKFSLSLLAELPRSKRTIEKDTVTIPKERPEHFEVFLAFADCGRINSYPTGFVDETIISCLCDLWMFGRAIRSTPFQDAATDAIIEEIQAGRDLPLDCGNRVKSDCLHNNKSSLMQLFLDIAVWKWNVERIDTYGIRYDFKTDIEEKRHRLDREGWPHRAPFSKHTGCHYHEHKIDGSACYKTMFPPMSASTAPVS